ncbi:hypothetical protein HRJ45_10390 [Vibrio coralliilyticus]|uniref:hypothetical protein n=1 Tax=Vibrio coralliilyticus TaxID=190893 RepID=UPI000C16D180|nr:hypothetical protein [Vibrio coralliilyticus]NRF25426.1 hypothetical protein [Vibrio coralliilyticus]NRF79512.1 hypothetical protein [Vibrio coralliilyticus]
MFRTKFFLLFSFCCTATACASTEDISSDKVTEEHIVEETTDIKEVTAADKPESKGKGIDGQALLDNEPTRQILSSLESVTDTLNVLTFGIFAGEHR